MEKKKNYELLHLLLTLITALLFAAGAATPLFSKNIFVLTGCFLVGCIVKIIDYEYIYKPHIKK